MTRSPFLCGINLQQWLHQKADACIIDEDINAAKFGRRLIDQRLALRGIGYITGNGRDLSTAPAQLSGNAFGFGVDAEVGDDAIGALARKSLQYPLA